MAYIPPPINKLPLGLLSFLGIKNGGQYPQHLQADLGASFELLDWYLQTNSISANLNANVTAVGFNAGWYTVPTGETWAVLAAQVNSQAVLGAGVSLGMFGAFTRSALQIIPTALTPVGATATTGAVSVASSQTGTIALVPPGGLIGVYCHNLVAGPVSVTLTLNYVPMVL